MSDYDPKRQWNIIRTKDYKSLSELIMEKNANAIKTACNKHHVFDCPDDIINVILDYVNYSESDIEIYDRPIIYDFLSDYSCNKCCFLIPILPELCCWKNKYSLLSKMNGSHMH